MNVFVLSDVDRSPVCGVTNDSIGQSMVGYRSAVYINDVLVEFTLG